MDREILPGAMSQENVEIVRRWIDAANADATESALSYLDPEIEWVTTGIFVERGPYHGHEGVLRYQASVEGEFEDVSVEAEDLIDAGEYVVAPIRFTGRGRRSSAPVELRMTLVCSVREGLIVHIQNYPTRTEALEAAGLSE